MLISQQNKRQGQRIRAIRLDYCFVETQEICRVAVLIQQVEDSRLTHPNECWYPRVEIASCGK